MNNKWWKIVAKDKEADKNNIEGIKGVVMREDSKIILLRFNDFFYNTILFKSNFSYNILEFK